MHVHAGNIVPLRRGIKAGPVKNKLYLNDDVMRLDAAGGSNMRLLSLFITVLLSVTPFMPAFAKPQKISRVLPLCEAATAMDAGCYASVDFNAQTAEAHLGKNNLAYWIEGTTLRIAARDEGDLAPDLCCTFQDQMQPLTGAQGLWGLQYNLPDIDETILDLSLLVDMRQTESLEYHGPKAPVAEHVDSLKGHTETI
jgi:hypothetical protein